MSFRKNKNESEKNIKIIDLSPTMTLEMGKDLINLLTSQQGFDIELNAEKIHKFGAQYLQILLAAKAAWNTDNKKLLITNVSDELRTSIEYMGALSNLFSEHIGLSS